MEEFLRTYGLWILVAGVFVAMHWFGMGCGAGHREHREEDPEGRRERTKQPAPSGRPSGGCH